MQQHTSLPRICDQCLMAFLTTVELHLAEGGYEAVCWCKHYATLAECSVRDGRVRNWMLDSPVSADDARIVISGVSLGVSAQVRQSTRFDYQLVT